MGVYLAIFHFHIFPNHKVRDIRSREITVIEQHDVVLGMGGVVEGCATKGPLMTKTLT